MSKQNNDRLRRTAIAISVLSAIRVEGITVIDEVKVLVLIALAEADPDSEYATLKSIGDQTSLIRPTIARYIKRFHSEGWITEISNPEDRRRRPLKMSDRGWNSLEIMLGMIP